MFGQFTVESLTAYAHHPGRESLVASGFFQQGNQPVFFVGVRQVGAIIVIFMATSG